MRSSVRPVRRRKKFLKDMQMEEVELFMKEFLPAYELTLDELQEGTK